MAEPGTYYIRDEMAQWYHGEGLAIGAVLEGRLVAFRYVRDSLDGLEPHDRAGVLRACINHPKLVETMRYLSLMGKVEIGRCSGKERTFTVI